MPGDRKLGRPTQHRMAMLRGMTTLLLETGRIQTTVARAKDLRSVTDKMITLGKTGTLAAKRAAMAFITKEEVVKKLFDQIAPSYADRNGGYTRVLKLGPRRGDGAEMAIIELVGMEKETAENEKAAKADKSGDKNKKKKVSSKPAVKPVAAKS